MTSNGFKSSLGELKLDLALFYSVADVNPYSSCKCCILYFPKLMSFWLIALSMCFMGIFVQHETKQEKAYWVKSCALSETSLSNYLSVYMCVEEHSVWCGKVILEPLVQCCCIISRYQHTSHWNAECNQVSLNTRWHHW